MEKKVVMQSCRGRNFLQFIPWGRRATSKITKSRRRQSFQKSVFLLFLRDKFCLPSRGFICCRALKNLQNTYPTLFDLIKWKFKMGDN